MKFYIFLSLLGLSVAQVNECKKDKECLDGASCHRRTRMCICDNGASSYPSCEKSVSTGCQEKCAAFQYCSRQKICLCRFGGMTKDTCCRKDCGKFRTCSQAGKCKCSFGSYRGKCIKCNTKCRRGFKCKWSKENLRYECQKREKPKPIQCNWTNWSACSKTCGEGEQIRKRRGKNKYHCKEAVRVCNLGKCISEWERWGSWGFCSLSCGTGYRIRRRTCKDVGRCTGFSQQHQICNTFPCPRIWAAWSAWSQCSGSCTLGVKIRKRICLSGNNCLGPDDEKKTCNLDVDKNLIQRTSSDFHSNNPERNVFDASCIGGCLTITKVVHWCSAIENQPEDLKKVQEICEARESCRFTPAQSFFGPKDCGGIKKTWIDYGCYKGTRKTNHNGSPQRNG